MQVSVICTVYNERDSIERLLDSLVAQTRLPDEVVICDGGSDDGTPDLIRAYASRLPNLRVLIEPGANISRGRNVAVAATSHPLIAATDAGVWLEPEWLERLIEPWHQQGGTSADAPIASAGFFLPDVEGVFQTAMAATVLPLVGEVNPDTFLPSSRSVAFTKEAWRRAGGYPEWLDYCEDLLFDFGVNAQRPDAPTAFVWAPGANAHFRPRQTLTSFWKQYFRYARGDGKADLWRRRHVARYVTYLVLLPALLGHGMWGFRARWVGWLGLLIGIVIYCRRPWQRLRVLGDVLSSSQWLTAVALVPLIRLVGDVAKMAGYPVGLLWRWRRRDRAEIAWRRSLARRTSERTHAPAD